MDGPAGGVPVISVALTIDDQVAGGLAFARRPGPLRTGFVNWLIVAGLTGAASWGVPRILDGDEALTVLVYAVLGALMVMAGYSAIWWIGLLRRLRRGARRGAFGPTDSSQAWTDSAGIHEWTPSTGLTQAYAYSQIDRIDQTHKHVFIWVSPTKALIIPWRVGRAQVAAFVDEVGRHCRDDVRKRLS
jgi:hypothetical protein